MASVPNWSCSSSSVILFAALSLVSTESQNGEKKEFGQWYLSQSTWYRMYAPSLLKRLTLGSSSISEAFRFSSKSCAEIRRAIMRWWRNFFMEDGGWFLRNLITVFGRKERIAPDRTADFVRWAMAKLYKSIYKSFKYRTQKIIPYTRLSYAKVYSSDDVVS